MTTLPPHLETLEADIQLAASRRVRQLRRRRRTAQIAGLLVLMLVMVGAGLAATGVGIFGWLSGGERGEARFSVDAGRIYDGPAPETVGCGVGAAGALSCRVGGGGDRVYDLLERVDRPPSLTRQTVFELLATEEAAAHVSPDRAAEIRVLVLGVPDDFFEKVSTLLALQSIGASGTTVTGGELVPPAGVPLLVVCEQTGEALSCRDLAGAGAVAVGAPVYRLRETPDWAPAPPGSAVSDVHAEFAALVASVWDRPLSELERTLLTVFASPATGAGIGRAVEVERAGSSTTP